MRRLLRYTVFMQHTITIGSLEAMLTFGEVIGRALRGGEILALEGDVGAGKTSFVKGLARGLAITAVIQSPTFTINRVYEGRDGLTLYHYDFYRLDEPGIMRNELSEALTDPKGVVALEWNETVRDLLPRKRTVQLSLTSTAMHTRDVKLIIPETLTYLKEVI